MLSREGVRRLVEYVDTATDKENGTIDIVEIKKNWEIKGIWAYLVRAVSSLEYCSSAPRYSNRTFC